MLQHRKALWCHPSVGALVWWWSSRKAEKHCRRATSTVFETAAKEFDCAAGESDFFLQSQRSTSAQGSSLAAFLCCSYAQIRSTPCLAFWHGSLRSWWCLFLRITVFSFKITTTHFVTIFRQITAYNSFMILEFIWKWCLFKDQNVVKLNSSTILSCYLEKGSQVMH